MEPGPEMAAFLSVTDARRVSPHDRIIVMAAEQRMESYFQARKYRAMTAVVDAMEHDPDEEMWATEAAAAEIRVALRLTRTAADTELRFALELQRRLPAVWQALVTGRIDIHRARTFSSGTAYLPDATARLVVERVIESAGGLTTGELRARLEGLVIEADPDGAQERYESAVKTRRVVTEPSSDGTANLLGLDLPPHRVAAANRKVNHLARSLKTKGETRSMDQLRADVYLDLLIGKHHRSKSDGQAGGTHLHADLDTLVGLAAHPGELNGYGPVVADIARQVAEEQQDTEWRWSVTDPATGQVLYDGVTRRRPSAALRRRVEARDQTCVFPGCRMPAVDCDIDHMKRWADGGATTEHNLAPACRHDNLLKEQHRWAYRRLPNGRLPMDHQTRSHLHHQRHPAIAGQVGCVPGHLDRSRTANIHSVTAAWNVINAPTVSGPYSGSPPGGSMLCNVAEMNPKLPTSSATVWPAMSARRAHGSKR
jgi:hypothetical protein